MALLAARLGLDEALLPELFVPLAERLRDPVGVEDQQVARVELSLPDGAVQLLEQPQHRARGVEPLQAAVSPQQQAGQVAAVRVPQASLLVRVLGEEEGGVGAVRRALVAWKVSDGSACSWVTTGFSMVLSDWISFMFLKMSRFLVGSYSGGFCLTTSVLMITSSVCGGATAVARSARVVL